MMGLYDKYILPKCLNFAMKAPAMTNLRQQLVPLAEGKVLEVGIGSGLNLPFYKDDVHVTGVDPSPELQVYARHIAKKRGMKVAFLTQGGESLPINDNAFDSVVMTWTLCTIPKPDLALAEIRRVLKPGGKIIFAEHGEAPDEEVRKWQNRIDPIWQMIAGGCHLNRRIETLYNCAGFAFGQIEKGYIPGPRWATYNYRGIATLA